MQIKKWISIYCPKPKGASCFFDNPFIETKNIKIDICQS
jgi:hypothetical protein